MKTISRSLKATTEQRQQPTKFQRQKLTFGVFYRYQKYAEKYFQHAFDNTTKKEENKTGNQIIAHISFPLSLFLTFSYSRLLGKKWERKMIMKLWQV